MSPRHKHGVVEIETEGLVGIHGARDFDEHFSEVGVDTPVVRLIGVGQRGAGNPAPKAHVIELALNRAQASFDVAETLAKRQLGKSQTKELIPARKSTEFVTAAVALDALVELVRGQVIHQLGENGATGKHALLSAWRAGRVPRRQKPSARVHIEKGQSPTYPHEHTGLISQARSDSRTVVM